MRHGERTWRFEREIDDTSKTLVFVDQITGTPRTMTRAELQRDVLAKRLTVATGDAAALGRQSAEGPDLITTLDDIPANHRTEIARRYRYVIFLRRRGVTRGQRRQIERELEKLKGRIPWHGKESSPTEDAKPPGASTVMEWMRRWEMSGGNIAALRNHVLNRRTPKRTHGAVLTVGRRLIRDFYLKQTRPTLIETKLLADREIAALANSGDAPKGTNSISTSTLRRLLLEVDPYERDVGRYGSSYAQNKWRYALEGIGAQRVMQRYEIDHTIIDIVVISDVSGMPLGRPTITIVVDSYSGYVCGFFISFWGTGLATTISALKVAISPKEDFLAGQDLSNPWLAYGIPMMFVVDNGLEFHSPQFHSIAMHLNTDLLFCKVRQPWLKPFVERALGSYLRYLPHAGRVEKPLDNYLPLNPDKTAVVTFGGLCTGLLKAFVDLHPFEINERKLTLPYDRFGDGLAKLLPPALPTSTTELDIIVAASKQLTVGHEGVTTSYLRYNSEELVDLWRATKRTFKTQVKFNPEDLSHVFVQDPNTKGWLLVPSCQPEYTADLSMVQHKAIRAGLKSDLDRRKIPEYLAKSKLELIDFWNSQSVKGKRLKQTQLRALAGLTSSHAIRPQPSDPQHVAKPASVPVGPEEMALPTFEIPTFETLLH